MDTLRRDALSLYGSETPTPAIDSLAADGVVFDRAFSTAPWTYVSFSSIHSGLTPWAHGIRYADTRIDSKVAALAPAMRDHGYNTVGIGSSSLLSAGAPAQAFLQSFSDRFFFPRLVTLNTRAQTILNSSYPGFLKMKASTEAVGEYGQEWARNHADAPFFMWLHFYDPHGPYDWVPDFPPVGEPPENLRGAAGRSFDPLEHRGDRAPGMDRWSRALYQAEVQSVDRSIGRFLEELKATGLYDKALIVFLSDHGEEFVEHNKYGHGQSLYNELVRVPLVIKAPQAKTAMRVEQLVSTVAIAPTIFDLAGIPYDEELFSAKSLRSAWRSPAGSAQATPVFMTGVGGGEPAEAVVWENFKFLRWQNIDHEELYDLNSDPGELYNVAVSRPEEVAIGKALLADHAEREAKRAEARGFAVPAREPLTPDAERLLRGLGYLQ